MTKVSATSSNRDFSLSLYDGDAKTLLAFDLPAAAARSNLAGFSIHVQAAGGVSYYLWNNLLFVDPAVHAQVPGEPPQSTANAPIRKFRWVHVPGIDHQGAEPVFGDYTYTVTPRYFDGDGHMLAIDANFAAAATISVRPFVKGKVRVGFTRGYVQSQAYVHRYGRQIPSRPKGGPLVYDTTQAGGTGPDGKTFTFADQYAWLGFTARRLIFDVLNRVLGDARLSLDVFAYDLNEPDVIGRLLELAPTGRVRIILDNASLHHSSSGDLPEDMFEDAFDKAAANGSAIWRGHFGRYSHDKVFIVYDGADANRTARSVLTGSTNFSVTGIYVNSNHVLVFDDAGVADRYAQVFDESWADKTSASKFSKKPLASQSFAFAATDDLPEFDVSFSPHQADFASSRLDEIIQRCNAEADRPDGKGSVFFAVMELSGAGANPVYTTLDTLNKNPKVFSYGISDSPDGLALYPANASGGILATGKPGATLLPHPFDQVPTIGGLGHQIHHKFVVCGFGHADAVVYCGSSNLAEGGEKANGDNLLAIEDNDIATAFVIDAILLVDHFNFLDRMAVQSGKKATADAPDGRKVTTVAVPADKRAAAADAGWFLETDDKWVAKYFTPGDLRCRDRALFA